MFTPDSPLDTSVTTSKSKLPVVCLRPRPLLSPPLSRRHVRTGQGPIPLSKQGHRNSYKKINTGMRCHLVSRPANTPGECPRPHGALTQISGGVCVFGGLPPPTSRLPSNLPDSLAPSAQVCGTGLHSSTFFCTHTRFAFVSHGCLWLADCFLSV